MRRIMYNIKFSKLALKDKKKIDRTNLSEQLKRLLDLMTINPFCYPPTYDKLQINSKTYNLRKMNMQHRLVYMVDEDKKEIYIIRMWTHYEKM